MKGKEMTEGYKTPGFCAICGSRLVASTDVTGYDPYTGEAVAAHRLECRNPSVEVNGGLLNKKTVYTDHPVWANSNGIWEQY